MSLRNVISCILLLFVISAPALAVNSINTLQMKHALANGVNGKKAELLVQQLRSTFGEEALRAGVGKAEGNTMMWAIEVDPGVTPVLVTKTRGDKDPYYWVWDDHIPVLEKNPKRLKLQRMGNTNVYAAVAELPNFSLTAYAFEVGGKRQGGGWIAIEHFPVHSDSVQHSGVPQGKVTKYHWKSKIFDGTERNYWVYVPAQYKPDGPPACLMVFQDGRLYIDSPVSAPVVFDNLISKGDMPLTVGVFIEPGRLEGEEPRTTRNNEYHEQSDRYVRFLRDEIIPEVSKIVNLRQDADSHAICGMSSGAACAFNAAWEMPSLFGKAMCHVGSFTNMYSSQESPSYKYSFLIRENDKKPLRVYLQDGSNDLDIRLGNWPLANQQMAMALKYKGYDYRFDYGRGYHSMAHGGAVFPDALRWLWKGYVRK